MRIIITRHGETVENKAGILMGDLPGKLSKTGIMQAKKLANRLKEEKIDHVYSSDLARTVDTVKEIIKYHPNAQIQFTKELREMHFGRFQGMKMEDIEKVRHNPYMLEGLESMESTHKRAKKFLFSLLKKHQHKTILVVGHNTMNLCLIAIITGKNHDQIEAIDSQRNASINIFEIDEKKKATTQIFNCTKHLYH